MSLAAERYWCAATTAVGQLGQPGAGGVASLVGRRRRSSGHGGGRVTDAPLLSTSSRFLIRIFDLGIASFSFVRICYYNNFLQTVNFAEFDLSDFLINRYAA